MTKKDFVCRLASTTGVNKADSEFMLDAVISMISDVLSEGEEVSLPQRTMGRILSRAECSTTMSVGRLVSVQRRS